MGRMNGVGWIGLTSYLWIQPCGLNQKPPVPLMPDPARALASLGWELYSMPGWPRTWAAHIAHLEPAGAVAMYGMRLRPAGAGVMCSRVPDQLECVPWMLDPSCQGGYKGGLNWPYGVGGGPTMGATCGTCWSRCHTQHEAHCGHCMVAQVLVPVCRVGLASAMCGSSWDPRLALEARW